MSRLTRMQRTIFGPIHTAEPGGDSTMDQLCPRCSARYRSLARFCGSCGLALPRDPANGTPGQLSDPRALDVPAGFERCGDAADLYVRSESAWGDAPIIGTEPLAVWVFNRG